MASPPGTVLPHPDKPDFFWVRGSECVYEVDAGSYKHRRLPSCECTGWAFHRHCYHLKAVADYLREWPLCPICHGLGFFFPNGSVRYVDVRSGVVDLSPIPLACCVGEGTREAWEREGRLIPREAA